MSREFDCKKGYDKNGGKNKAPSTKPTPPKPNTAQTEDFKKEHMTHPQHKI